MELIERVARAIDPDAWEDLLPGHESCPQCLQGRNEALEKARAAIGSLGIPQAALEALLKGEAVIAPKEPTKEMINAATIGATTTKDALTRAIAASPWAK